MIPRGAQALLFGLALAACSGGGGRRNPDASTTRDASADTGSRDATVDTGPDMSCASDAECDDDQMCTIDSCALGGVCRHVTEDSFCATGERCDAVRGCTTGGCSVDAECDNGVHCDGAEKCITSGTMGFCVMDAPVSCDDGNACTVDTCDETLAGCTYALADGCDAGVPSTDSGTPAVPFDPTMHYTGSFLVAPAPSLGCTGSSYSISTVTFSTTSSTLTVTADRFSMSQSPIPTGPVFDVRGTDGSCSTVELAGTFDDSNTLHATWNANCAASGCLTHTNDLVGVRRD